MKTPPKTVKAQAFSLIEVLVSLSVVSVLAALILGATKNVQTAGLRADGLSRMRQVGMAVQTYAGENNGSLPGPLWSGQSPWYNTGDIRTLGYQLWNYLGAPAPTPASQEAPILASKAYVMARPKKDAMSFLVNQGVKISGIDYKPWGYQDNADPAPTSLPMKISMLEQLGLSKTWAMQDVDKTHKYINSGYGWYASLPNKPLYSPGRLCLYFDWHVAIEPIK